MQETIPSGDNIPSTDGYTDTTNTNPQDTTIGSDLPDDTTSPNDNPNDTDVSIDEINGETFTMLLVGTDYQPELFDDYDYEQTWEGPGFPDRRNRPWGADMIIMLRVDKENRQFMFCPIPRNTRMLVDGTYIQLGDALCEKGIDYLCGKVASLTGLNIDYYVKIDVGSIADIVDTVGTVEFNIPEDMIYSDPSQNLEINLTAGTTEVDGATAAQLLRYVGYSNGDVGRMNTAIELCSAVLEKFTDVRYFDEADDIYGLIKKDVQTNFSLDDLLNNLDLIFSYNKFKNVTESYPGYNKVYDGIAYFEPSLTSALKKFDAYK